MSPLQYFTSTIRSNGTMSSPRSRSIPVNTTTDHISLFSLRPDGLQLAPLYGFHSREAGTDGSNITYSQPGELDDGRLVAIARPAASDTLGGDIVIIDTPRYTDFTQANWNNPGLTGPGHQSLTDTGVRTDALLSAGGQFSTVFPLRDGSGRLLVTWSDCRVLDEANPDDDARVLPCSMQPDNTRSAGPLYGGWLYDPVLNTQRPVVVPQAGFQVTELIAAEPRAFADILPTAEEYDATLAQQSLGLLRIDSVYDLDGIDNSPAGISRHATPGTDTHASRPARFLRFAQAVPLPDRDLVDIPRFAAGVAGGNRFREILGYVPVEPDGSVSVTVPANRPFSFSVLDERGRRIGAPHRFWLQVGAGEIVHCAGCHDHASGLPHGRTAALRPQSANPGAITLEGALGFPNTRTDALFATQPGQTMAEVWDFHEPQDNPNAAARPLSMEPRYEDEWHAAGIDPDDSITDRGYSETWTDIPPERALVVSSFDPEQPPRIVINYVDHIQPIWERIRDTRLNANEVEVDTCIGCHNSRGNSAVAPGQLDLSPAPSDLDADHYRSYRELLSTDQEQWLNADNVLADRQRECTEVTEDGETIVRIQTIPLSPPARAGFANGSTRFFGCFESTTCGRPPTPPLPDNCTEPAGTIFPATNGTVDHRGLLSEAELRLLSEWLDLGGQYYNNPFDARVLDQ